MSEPTALDLPTPPLTVGELALRPWRLDDADALVAAWHDPEIVRWSAVPDARDHAAARRWIEAEPLRRERGLALDLVVTELENDAAVLGEVGLSSIDRRRGAAFVGYWTALRARRRHVATRAAGAVAVWALDPAGPLALRMLVARCDPANHASHGVAGAAGFVPAGTDREGFDLFVRRAGAPVRTV
ncbi:MAG: GNAT family N-acetyltransferase [Acidimicrobiales bacterium]|nr:GNAT family N-acetyltransferase [Acidimicrobiales bacterium]